MHEFPNAIKRNCNYLGGALGLDSVQNGRESSFRSSGA